VKDGELWKLWYNLHSEPEDMAQEIDRRLGMQAAGSICHGRFSIPMARSPA